MFESYPFMQPIEDDDEDGYSKIPEHTLYAIRQYIAHGQPLGGFLEKVVSGDGTRAITDADLENKRSYEAICRFVSIRAPLCCIGSKLKYDVWITIGGLRWYNDYVAAIEGRANDLTERTKHRLKLIHASYAEDHKKLVDSCVAAVHGIGITNYKEDA